MFKPSKTQKLDFYICTECLCEIEEAYLFKDLYVCLDCLESSTRRERLLSFEPYFRKKMLKRAHELFEEVDMPDEDTE